MADVFWRDDIVGPSINNVAVYTTDRRGFSIGVAEDQAQRLGVEVDGLHAESIGGVNYYRPLDILRSRWLWLPAGIDVAPARWQGPRQPWPPSPHPSVFDSGVGGLTVLNALRTRLPHESFLYLGDTARLPYGTKSATTVARSQWAWSSQVLPRRAKFRSVDASL